MSEYSAREDRYEPSKIPPKITRKMFVAYGVGEYNAGTIVIADYVLSSGDFATIPLAEVDFTVDLAADENEIKNKLIDQLKAERRELMAAHEISMRVIDEKIQNLLSIEYKPIFSNEAEEEIIF